MKRVALALSLLLVAACDVSVSTSALDFDAGLSLPDGGSAPCEQNPCLNDGECVLTNDGFQCTCQPGYEGDLCESDVNDCDPNPCLNDGMCTDGVASYSCDCAAGFEGVDCSTNIDDCADSPCQNDGVCTDMVNSYSCDCPAGYSGSSCEVDVDDCSPSPCENDGACVDGVNAFTCICTDGHSGVTCSNSVDSCKADSCQNGATCADSPGGYTCTCKAGYNGANCETDIDDCATMPCENGAICTDKVNGYSCECPDGTTGANCENLVDPCDPSPCLNGGECSSAGSDAYVCSCVVPGYNGVNCENNVDDCQTNPCKNGGTCTDLVNDFSCDCPTGYEGSRTCDNDPPSCPAQNPCEHGTCGDGVDGYKCTCDAGFTGVLCDTNIDDCAADPCVHGTCTDGDNSFTCTCDAGYEGTCCDVDTDDCASLPCQNGGTCVDAVDGYSCDCVSGYGGDNCAANIDDCTPSSCLNGGTCQDGLNAFTCECARFYSGDQCEINECSMIGICSGHGMCDGQGGCACNSGWQGTDCETNIDECMTTHPCLHGSACLDSQGSYSCTCVTGYTGVTCDACDSGYQDEDHDDVCCPIGAMGATCSACQAGYENVNGTCQKTCASTMLACGSHGTCSDNGGDPLCVCSNGYYGPACDSLQGTCSVSTCNANGTCVATSDASYTCTCNTAYTGRSCATLDYCMLAESMQHTPCSNNGQCISGANAYTCMCNAGWLGAECDNSDECYAAGSSACSNHGQCVDGDHTYTCMCQAGWLDAHCDNPDDCIGNACMNGGVCHDGNNTYTCDCTATDYNGNHCQTKIDRCAGITACKNGGTCVDNGPGYDCNCANTGFSGPTCELDADECAASPNVCNTGVCTNSVLAGGGYSCACPDGTLDVEGDGKTCSTIVSLAAGALNTCAISAAGSLHCWGDNAYGQVSSPAGNPMNASSLRVPTRIGTGTGWTKVAVGGRFATNGMTPTLEIGHVCAIRNGHLFCWGDNSRLQLGTTSVTYSATPIEPRSDLTWSDVTAGDAHTCALSGTALYCWGNSTDGEAGTPVNPPNVDAPKPITGTWLSVSAGSNHTCAINSAKELHCWGNNSAGQLGASVQPVALPVGSDGDWTAVSAGVTHTCAVAGTKTYCWGTVAAGSLGDGSTTTSPTPILVTSASSFDVLATGQDFSCGSVKDPGPATTFQLDCWGTNANSLLLTNDPSAAVPQVVTRGSSVWSAFATGTTHACGVDNGLLYCWGTNADGALGRGAPDGSPTHAPAPISTSSSAHSGNDACSPNPCKNGGACSSSNGSFTCDCTSTGYSGTTCEAQSDACATASCGQGSCTNLSNQPGYTCKCPDGKIDVEATGKVCATVTTIAGSSNNSCVLTDAGTLHCWGTNRTGQLGLGAVGTTAFYPDENTQMVRTPLRVKSLLQGGPAISDWQKVVVGFSHVCATRRPALATNDELYCWGRNVDNEVGVGTDSPVVWPRLLDNTRTWTALAATWTHTCGIAGGELFCWGVNLDGELAKPASNSELFDASMPIPVPSGEGGAWTNVATGGAHTCAVTTNSNVYCWGYGGDGELGDGTTNAVESPVKVMAATDPGGFVLLDADYSQVCGLSGTQAYCWGANGAGAVGAGDFMTPKTAPVAVVNNINFNLLTLGSNFSCGLAAVSGTSAPYYVYCWGANARNYNLTGATTNTNAPTLLAGRTWRTFQAAPGFVCGVDDADGLLYCWGYNGIENSVGIGTLGTVPYSLVGNFPIATVKAAAVSYTSP